MKVLRKFWREISCTILFSLFLYSVSLWVNDPPKTALTRFIFMLLSFSDIAIFLMLLRQLWRKKWRPVVSRATSRIFGSAARFFMRIFERVSKKLGLGARTKKNVIGGKTQITFDQNVFEKEKISRKKAIKWKQLQSDRDRLRYLYRNMITHKIRGGERIHPADTPSEIEESCERDVFESELFSLYIDARYDERAELDADIIEKLKDSSVAAYGKIK